MHHNDPFAARVCPHCDGFATAGISCGFNGHGERIIAFMDCPACGGWGSIPRLPRHRFASKATRPVAAQTAR
ncbi:hypothetical protein [Streptomyces lunalinharesii]|uniref:Uncharacterized protein n=1 Tax=Streptomyces lunalinharesii TaxID=333384 RepID=A0ABP6FJU3_9ACTN